MKKPKLTEFSALREKARLTIEEAADRLGYSYRTVYRWENGEICPKPPVLKELRDIAEAAAAATNVRPPAFRFIDLFAGIGGLRLAFEAAGGQCVFTSEWDLACRTTYQANFPCSHQVAGDIREVHADEIPQHDVLVAGFPCQPFSIAGVSKKNALGRPHGFNCDTQGTLFYEIERILDAHRPAAFLLENVKNLVNHDKGLTFRVILEVLERKLGYTVEYRVLDAKGWVPQHRERIFIVGFRDNVGFDFDTLVAPDAQKGPRLKSILHPENGSEEEEPPYTTGANGKVSVKYTLSDKLWQYLQNYAAKHRAKGNGFGFGLVKPGDVARTLSARYYKDGSEILVAQKGKNPRRLTPRECARLMGFDSGNRPPFHIPVSDTQAYKQFGNSVAVPAATAVAMHMKPFIARALRSGDPLVEPELSLGDADEPAVEVA